jgi:hypothetical protein
MLRLVPLAPVLLTLLSACSSTRAGEEVPEGEKAGLMASIETRRKAIEARDSLVRKTVATTGLREQIKQKWSRIDYYADGDQVVRIKTYPHAQVSTRTEEFYFDGGQLMYAYIEDKGTEDKERGGARTGGKEYFFARGKFVGEKNWSGEQEHSIRYSDEERLEQEALEYLELYRTQNKG